MNNDEIDELINLIYKDLAEQLENNQYRKIIDIGNLPNNDTKIISTGLTFDNKTCILTNIYGKAVYQNDSIIEQIDLPYNTTNISRNVYIAVKNSGEILIITNNDESRFKGKLVLEYLKF